MKEDSAPRKQSGLVLLEVGAEEKEGGRTQGEARFMTILVGDVSSKGPPRATNGDLRRKNAALIVR